jgi:hypothetical protein
MKNILGILALCLGILGLALGLAAGPLADLFAPAPRPLDEAVVEFAGKMKDRLIAKTTGKEYVPTSAEHPRTVWINRVGMTSVVLGFLAIVAAVLGYIRQENRRICYAAASLGAGTIVMWYLFPMLAVLVLLLLLSVVAGALLT